MIIFFSFSEKKLLHTKIKTKTEEDPTCTIFSKSRRFEDIKYDNEWQCCDKVRKSESQQHFRISSISAPAESAESAKSAKTRKISKISKIRDVDLKFSFLSGNIIFQDVVLNISQYFPFAIDDVL